MKDKKEIVKVVLNSEQYLEISNSKAGLIDELVKERDITTTAIKEQIESLKKIKEEILKLEKKYDRVSRGLVENKKYKKDVKNELGRQRRIAKNLNDVYVKQKAVDVSRFYTDNEKNKTR